MKFTITAVLAFVALLFVCQATATNSSFAETEKLMRFANESKKPAPMCARILEELKDDGVPSALVRKVVEKCIKLSSSYQLRGSRKVKSSSSVKVSSLFVAQHNTNTTKHEFPGAAAAVEQGIPKIEAQAKELAKRANEVAHLELPSAIDFLLCRMHITNDNCMDGRLRTSSDVLRAIANYSLQFTKYDALAQKAFDAYKGIYTTNAKMLIGTVDMLKALSRFQPTDDEETETWMELFDIVNDHFKVVSKAIHESQQVLV